VGASEAEACRPTCDNCAYETSRLRETRVPPLTDSRLKPTEFVVKCHYGRPVEQGRPLYFHPVVSFYLSSSFSFPHLISAVAGCLPYLHTWCGLSANLRCRSETCCTGLAANTGRKKLSKNRQLGTIAQLCRAISSQLRHVSTIDNRKTCEAAISPPHVPTIW